jgi:hypothetical protein
VQHELTEADAVTLHEIYGSEEATRHLSFEPRTMAASAAETSAWSARPHPIGSYLQAVLSMNAGEDGIATDAELDSRKPKASSEPYPARPCRGLWPAHRLGGTDGHGAHGDHGQHRRSRADDHPVPSHSDRPLRVVGVLGFRVGAANPTAGVTRFRTAGAGGGGSCWSPGNTSGNRGSETPCPSGRGGHRTASAAAPQASERNPRSPCQHAISPLAHPKHQSKSAVPNG